MAKRTEKTLHFRARVSFMDIRQGEEAAMPLDATVQGWLNAGLIEEVGSGQSEAGPSSAEPDDAIGEPNER
jgi:hypothetical protein